MIEEFEKAIATGAGSDRLNQIREHLRRAVETDRLQMLEKIEKDFQTAQLILYGLAQDRGSIPYSIAMGFKRWFEKQHPAGPDLAAELMRSIRREEYETKQMTKGAKSHDGIENHDRKAADPDDGTERASESSQEGIHAAIPAEEPGPRPAMEP